jgi:hypothetical protein
MIQVMEQLLLAANPPHAPTEEEITVEFGRRRDELRKPPRYSIEHIYFSREREAEAAAIIAQVKEQNLTPVQARELSSPFLPGYQFTAQSPDQLARHFGAALVENLQQADPQPGRWVGPIRSTYGLHYVWISAVEPAREATLEEVRQQLVRDLESRAKDTALRDSINAMRQNYEIRQ